MPRVSVWKKKGVKKTRTGSYDFGKKTGERIFVLTDAAGHKMQFGSVQDAVKKGWSKK